MEDSQFKKQVFYGSIAPLENDFFDQEKINPYSISNEGIGICFTTSSQEASKVYAQPPINTDNANSFDEVLELRKSEWYAKTEAILFKQKGHDFSFEELSKLREEFSSKSNPCLYPCHINTQNPFIVNNKIGVNISPYSDMSDIAKFVLDKHYNDFIELSRYEQVVRMALFSGLSSQKDYSMTDAVNDTTQIFKQFSRKTLKKPEELNTQGFYAFLLDKFQELGLQGQHNNIFKALHDSVILENPSYFYANAKYDNNQHIIVFDVNNITFSVSNEKNSKQKKLENIDNNICNLVMVKGTEAFDYLDKYGNEFANKFSLAPTRDHIFAIKDNTIVGIVLLQDQEKSKSLKLKNTVTLSNLIVHPDYRQKGISKQLTKFLAHYLNDNNLILRRTDPTNDGKSYLFNNMTSKLKELNVPFVTEESSWIYKEIENKNPNKTSKECFDLYSKFIKEIVLERDNEIFDVYENNYVFQYQDLEKLRSKNNKKRIKP